MTVGIRVARSEDEDAIARLAFEYLDWAVNRLRDDYGVEWPPLTLEDVRGKVEEYRSEGTFLVAEEDGEVVGIGALRWLAQDVAEVKRMYVVPARRGTGVGSALLDTLISIGVDGGAAVIRLDTIRFMADAQRMYRSRGFVERGPYEGTEIPAAFQSHWLFFERMV